MSQIKLNFSIPVSELSTITISHVVQEHRKSFAGDKLKYENMKNEQLKCSYHDRDARLYSLACSLVFVTFTTHGDWDDPYVKLREELGCGCT